MRRIKYDLVMTYNIVHKRNGLKFDQFFAFTQNERHSTRNKSRNSLLLDVPRSCINARFHFFAVRSVKFWNFLDDKVVLATSTESFKEKLKNVDLSSLCLVNDF